MGGSIYSALLSPMPWRTQIKCQRRIIPSSSRSATSLVLLPVTSTHFSQLYHFQLRRTIPFPFHKLTPCNLRKLRQLKLRVPTFLGKLFGTALGIRNTQLQLTSLPQEFNFCHRKVCFVFISTLYYLLANKCLLALQSLGCQFST